MSANPSSDPRSEQVVHEHPTYQRVDMTEEGRSTGRGMGQDLVIIAGLWVAISPWVMNFQANGLAEVNNVIIGLAIASFGVLAMSGLPSFSFLKGVTAVLGGWMVAAPFALAVSSTVSTPQMISDVVCGAVVFLTSMGLLSSSAVRIPFEVHVGRRPATR